MKGFDVKKERILKMTTNENIFKDLVTDSDIQIDKDE